SDEEVEMIGEAGGEEEEEEEEELEPSTPPKKSKNEKVQKSRRSSKKARAEDEAEEVNSEENKKSRRSSKKARAEEEGAKEANGEERNNDDVDRKKCNSRRLYKIMLENMNESSASSKRTINTVAEAEFGTSIDVICSRGHFSYVFSSNLYCEASKGHVTCIAFRQAPPAVTEE
ncbi:grl-10, partial [Pristionchus pacificus]